MRVQSLSPWPPMFSSEMLFLLQSSLQLPCGSVLPLPHPASPTVTFAVNLLLITPVGMCFLRKQISLRREGTWKPVWSKWQRDLKGYWRGTLPASATLMHDGNSRNYTKMLKDKTRLFTHFVKSNLIKLCTHPTGRTYVQA